jgi:hypothetical protein
MSTPTDAKSPVTPLSPSSGSFQNAAAATGLNRLEIAAPQRLDSRAADGSRVSPFLRAHDGLRFIGRLRGEQLRTVD